MLNRNIIKNKNKKWNGYGYGRMGCHVMLIWYQMYHVVVAKDNVINPMFILSHAPFYIYSFSCLRRNKYLYMALRLVFSDHLILITRSTAEKPQHNILFFTSLYFPILLLNFLRI